MTKIQILQTGTVWIKAAQVRARGAGLMRIYNGLFDADWSPELPIYAYLIEHPEGLILVDTGETARAMRRGYFPLWHPYYHVGIRLNVQPDDEIGPQLRLAGFDPRDVKTIVLTHLHTDHAGGLAWFDKVRVLVSKQEYEAARGFAGRVAGYPNHRWPKNFTPELQQLPAIGSDLMDASMPLTSDGAVRLIAAPGHTRGQMAVSVEIDGIMFLLAGDVSYLEQTLRDGIPDGLGADPAAQLQTHARILAMARRRPLVYLNGHDPNCRQRLQDRQTLQPPA
ncbi:MAG: N-acyl homoserine lactonase family protein [Hyphomicrobiales bacterium]|nr:N-acyl homoserine lactonase family protein [Hyphomicrobiales bacterium]